MQSFPINTNGILEELPGLNSLSQNIQDYCLCLPYNFESQSQLLWELSKPNIDMISKWISKPDNCTFQEDGTFIRVPKVGWLILDNYCLNIDLSSFSEALNPTAHKVGDLGLLTKYYKPVFPISIITKEEINNKLIILFIGR